MRLLFFGDLQAAVSNLPQCQMVADQVCGILKQWNRKSGRYVVFLGDAKDSLGALCDVRVSNFIIENFRRIRKNCEGLYFVRGNHDSIGTTDGVPSLVPWIRSAGADAVADDRSIHVNVSGVSLLMVPYFRDPKRQLGEFQSAAAAAQNLGTRVKILAFHQEVAGCDLNGTRKGTGITPADMGADTYSLCVGGHIHRPQFLKPNIYFCGSPFPTSWAEANIVHRMLAVEI